MAISLNAEKGIGIVTILLGAVIGAALPLCFQRSPRGLILADAFAGGVFLSVALVHMLMEATEDIEAALPQLADVPLSSTLSLVGFIFTLICGKVLVSEQAVIQHLHAGNKQGSQGRINDTSPEEGRKNETTALLLEGNSASLPYYTTGSPDDGTTREIHYNSSAFGAGVHAALEMNRQAHPDTCSIDAEVDMKERPSYMPYILLLILSVHSFLAGVALGTSDTSSTAVGIILAIVCHKGSAAMALGVTMLQNGVERRRYLG